MEMTDRERRLALAEFLRMRRAALSPADVGLPEGGRRRTSGLRREELATLANIGVSWYTALEQGRDVSPSEQVLESLAKALRLSAAERQHLFLLAKQFVPVHATPPVEEVSPVLQRIVHMFNPHPACVLGRRWDLLVWNQAAEEVFRYSEVEPRNLVWLFFAKVGVKEMNYEWEVIAKSAVAQVRADYARYPGDVEFGRLIDSLQEECEAFRQLWSKHDVQGTVEWRKKLDHPTLGFLEFETTNLQVAANPDLKLLVFHGSPETEAKLTERLQREEPPVFVHGSACKVGAT